MLRLASRRSIARKTLAALLVATVLLPASGCGGGRPSVATPVTVLLDWTPNPAHAGILTALAIGADRDRGVAVKLRTPSSSSDGVRLLLSGRADLAVLDIHDLAIARERGRDLVAVMAIVGRPLASLIAHDAKRPRDLEGRTVGVSGTASDIAVLDAIVRGDGGDPSKVRVRNAGFAATEALLGGRVDGATAFFNQEGVALARLDRGFRTFRLDAFGAPAYPELVLVAPAASLRDRAGLIQRVVDAFAIGTRKATSDPAAALSAVTARVRGGDPKLVAAQTRAALTAILPPDGKAGSLDPALLRRWARWEAASGIVRREPDVDRLAAPAFAQRSGS